MLQFSPLSKRVASLRLRVGDRCLTVVSAYGQNNSAEYPAFLQALGRVLESALPGDSIILLGDFNAHIGNNSITCREVIGRNNFPDLNPSGVIGLLCWPQSVHNEHYVPIQGGPSLHVAPGHPRAEVHD